MSNLVPYDLDLDALETDILELSLSEACEKYKNWAQHKGGACVFDYVTRGIARHEIVITEYPTFASSASFDEIIDKFNREYEMFQKVDRHYVDESESVSWKLGESLQV